MESTRVVGVNVGRKSWGRLRLIALLGLMIVSGAAFTPGPVLGVGSQPGSCSAGTEIATSRIRSRATYANFYIPLSNGAYDLVAGGGDAWFRTCSYGHIRVYWTSSMYDNGSLSWLGVMLQIRTNTGRVITSTKQWINCEPWECPYGTERSHYDVVAGEYPVRARFIFLGRRNVNGGTAIGRYTRTCLVSAYNATTYRCRGSYGYGDWSVSS